MFAFIILLFFFLVYFFSITPVSLNPAKAMGIDKDYGSIEVGKKADLVIADILDGYPVVTHVLVDGQTTSRVEYRGHSI